MHLIIINTNINYILWLIYILYAYPPLFLSLFWNLYFLSFAGCFAHSLIISPYRWFLLIISQPEAWWDTKIDSGKLCQVFFYFFFFMEYFIFFARSCLMCFSMIKICINTTTFHLNFWMHFFCVSLCFVLNNGLRALRHGLPFKRVSKISGFPDVQTCVDIDFTIQRWEVFGLVSESWGYYAYYDLFSSKTKSLSMLKREVVLAFTKGESSLKEPNTDQEGTRFAFDCGKS